MSNISFLVLEILKAQAAGKIKAEFHSFYTQIILESQIKNASEKANKIKKYILENFDIASCTVCQEMPENVITITIYHRLATNI